MYLKFKRKIKYQAKKYLNLIHSVHERVRFLRYKCDNSNNEFFPCLARRSNTYDFCRVFTIGEVNINALCIQSSCWSDVNKLKYLIVFRFSSGIGLFFFIQGNSHFLMAPIVGWIRDTTKSFPICFNALTSLMFFCIISWTGEMLWLRFCDRKIKKTESGKFSY